MRISDWSSDVCSSDLGAPRGAELIAAKWADNRGVQQVVFKPDWARHQKAAPFKRNDAMLEVMPIGVIAFPGSGITEDRKSAVSGTRVSARVDRGGRRIIQKNITGNSEQDARRNVQ